MFEVLSRSSHTGVYPSTPHGRLLCWVDDTLVQTIRQDHAAIRHR